MDRCAGAGGMPKDKMKILSSPAGFQMGEDKTRNMRFLNMSAGIKPSKYEETVERIEINISVCTAETN